ncbi:MAG: AraC family transcriptional regulator [Ferruginibacter sp.]
MQTSVLTNTIYQNEYLSNSKALFLNGYHVIQFLTIYQGKNESICPEENVLIFVIGGALKMYCGKMEYEVNKNNMAFIKKNVLLELQAFASSDSAVKSEYIIFSLKNDLIKEFIKLAELCINAREETLPVTVNSIDIQLLKYIESLDPYFHAPEKVEANLVKLKLLELLFYLSSLHNKILQQLLDSKEDFRSNITATVEENIMNPLSLHQLAVLTGRSLSSFRRDFLAVYNMPPSQWIRQKKLEKSKELLISTTMTVTDICHTTGFENIAHFSRLFKSQFGCGPLRFRMRRVLS